MLQLRITVFEVALFNLTILQVAILKLSMMLRRIYILLIPVFFMLINSVSLSGQGELNTQRRTLYRNERTFGIFLNSNGLGADFSYAERLNARNHRLYQVELLYLKHPKEVKITNSIYTNKSFVFGKINNFYEIRGQWGTQSEIYRKNDANGISVRYFYTLGPTIGLLKPIYYEIWVNSGSPTDPYTLKVDKFNTSIHQLDIYGKARFTEGLDEISIIPGASAKFGFSFEFSKMDKVVNSIEFGAGFDIFPRKIPLMANEMNQLFYLNLFAGYRFGKVIDISDAAIARRQRSYWFDRKTSRKVVKEEKKAAKQQDDF